MRGTISSVCWGWRWPGWRPFRRGGRPRPASPTACVPALFLPRCSTRCFCLRPAAGRGGKAWGRLAAPEPVAEVTVVTTIGSAINCLTARLFAAGRHGDLDIRGAYPRMAADAAVSDAGSDRRGGAPRPAFLDDEHHRDGADRASGDARRASGRCFPHVNGPCARTPLRHRPYYGADRDQPCHGLRPGAGASGGAIRAPVGR